MPSQYYNPHRSKDWNYGGPKWRLSRSKIDLFIECPRCFYIDNKLGTARPKGYPLNLNSAVDALLKKEFDYFRSRKEAHPICVKYNLNLIPFDHPKLNQWRDNFTGVEYEHETYHAIICGAVDDIWINEDGEIVVVDYKSTSKNGEVGIDAEWQDGYKRQMEIYQWLLRRNGLKVSSVGYFLYANGIQDKDMFDATLEFELTLHSHEGDDSWVEETIADIFHLLNGATVPDCSDSCDHCLYWQALSKHFASSQVPLSDNPTLFD